MTHSTEQQPWQTHDRLVEINSLWVKLIGDRLEDNTATIGT
ncbi:hypothetical protein [Spirulina sp. 06S082]|nr:hypothetical protein [Spirulina sp. 06S082]MEA5470571.1 hypothetical protein [Spirulina sp. 06S082]